jgi:dihydroorotate dehydrogenase (NAD+) catalytic subunit
VKRRPIAAKRVDLSVRIGSPTLRNPILTASGTFGYGDEYAHVVDLATIGGVVTKTVTVHPRAGNAPTRVAETASGMLNSIGLENVGLARFRDEKLPRLATLKATVIASLGGETPDELETLLRALGRETAVGAFEINFSCPNVAAGGARFWADPARLEATLKGLRRSHGEAAHRQAVARRHRHPRDRARLRARRRRCGHRGQHVRRHGDRSRSHAQSARQGHGRTRRVRPSSRSRSRAAGRRRTRCACPVVGSGGIVSGRDALEFIAAGATAVQVGTATFVEPQAATRVLAEMREWLAAHGHARLTDSIGAFDAPAAQDRAPAPTPRGRS